MQIVIDISEVFYEYCKAQEDAIEIQLAVKKGTPLPKGHGRLIDADEIRFESREFDTYEDYSRAFDAIDYAETIVEAESEEEA